MPAQDTTANTGNDEFDEDESAVAAQGTVIYQYDTGQTTGSNQGGLPYLGLPTTCKFYILGDAPGASMVDDSDINATPPSAGAELESDYIAFVDHVTDAALPAFLGGRDLPVADRWHARAADGPHRQRRGRGRGRERLRLLRGRRRELAVRLG